MWTTNAFTKIVIVRFQNMFYKCKLTPTEFSITDFLEVCIQMLALHDVFVFKSCLWMYSDGVSEAILDYQLYLRPVKIDL